MTFSPPSSGSTRLSPDVWALICDYATANGNSSTRDAIEQLIRLTLGNAQPVNVAAAVSPQTEKQPTASIPTGNALSAFEELGL